MARRPPNQAPLPYQNRPGPEGFPGMMPPPQVGPPSHMGGGGNMNSPPMMGMPGRPGFGMPPQMGMPMPGMGQRTDFESRITKTIQEKNKLVETAARDQ